MLYTLNLHNVTCQLYPNKTGGKKKGEAGFFITYLYPKEENTDTEYCETFQGYIDTRNPYQ